MTTLKIKLAEISDVKEFSQIMLTCPKSADIVSGRYTVDAKSIMGIFSLNLSNPVELRIDGDEDEVADTIKALRKFLVD